MSYYARTGVIPLFAAKSSARNATQLLSPQFLYHEALVEDNLSLDNPVSIDPQAAFQVLTRHGICISSFMKTFTEDPSASATANALLYRVPGISFPTIGPKNRELTIKEELQSNRPVIFAVSIDNAFTNGKSEAPAGRAGRPEPIWNCYRDDGYKQTKTQGHCMVIIGWDNDIGGFLVQNSLGPGRFWITYKFLDEALSYWGFAYKCKLPSETKNTNARRYCIMAARNSKSKRWKQCWFDVDPSVIDNGKLQPGAILAVKDDYGEVQLRSDMPSRQQGKWRLGNVVGALKTGQYFSVQKVEEYTPGKPRDTSYVWIGGIVVSSSGD